MARSIVTRRSCSRCNHHHCCTGRRCSTSWLWRPGSNGISTAPAQWGGPTTIGAVAAAAIDTCKPVVPTTKRRRVLLALCYACHVGQLWRQCPGHASTAAVAKV